MKKVVTPVAAMMAAAGLLLAGPASASPCTDRMAALEARLDEAAETSISTSSGGQGVAGAREGQAMHAENQDVPVGEPAVPYQEEEREEEVVERAADEAAGGGDNVMQAKAALNQAQIFDREGDTAACEEALAEAQALLDDD